MTSSLRHTVHTYRAHSRGRVPRLGEAAGAGRAVGGRVRGAAAVVRRRRRREVVPAAAAAAGAVRNVLRKRQRPDLRETETRHGGDETVQRQRNFAHISTLT